MLWIMLLIEDIILSLFKKLLVNPKTIERDLEALKRRIKYVDLAKQGYWNK
jgi:hypothetical protein